MAIPQIQNDTVYALPHLYVQGLQLSAATPTAATVIAVAPGAARDSSNNIDMVVGLFDYFNIDHPALQFLNYQAGLFINSVVNGVNGLDTGAIAASTQYAVYLIGDSRNYLPTAAVLSLTSNIAPTLPQGYDSYRLIGFWATDASKHFVYATVKPQNIGGLLTYFNSPGVSVLSGGTSATFAAVDLTTNAAVPVTTLQNVIVTFLATFTPAAVGDTAQFRPTGSTATGGLPTITGIQAGFAQNQYIQVIAGQGSSVPSIDYKLTSSSDALTLTVVEWAGVSNSAYPALV
jgi:hypothetical protein